MTANNSDDDSNDRNTDARIAVSPDTRDLVRAQKRAGETYDDLLQKMADQYDPDKALDSYDVPLIDPETGDGWDETVKAIGPKQAMQKAIERAEDNGPADEVHVASSYVQEHYDIPASIEGDR